MPDFCHNRFLCRLIPLVIAGAVTLACTALYGQPDSQKSGHGEVLVFEAPKMGTIFRISLVADDAEEARAAAEAAFALIDELNAIFSDYLPESELSRLCRAKPGTAQKVSDELFEVLSEAKLLSEQTGGAFDATAGNLTNLWRRSRRKGELPSPEVLKAAKALTGPDLIRLAPKHQTVTLLKEGMLIDLGGIAKGYAADAAIAELKKRGFPHAIVAAGGDIAIGDPPPGKDGWPVTVAALDTAEGGKPVRYLLANCGISTSGDTQQSVEIAGKRYSHIVDPRTGLGLVDRIGVTVIAPSAMFSDCHATAASALGWEAGREFIQEKKGLEGRFVRNSANNAEIFEIWTTDGFPAELK